MVCNVDSGKTVGTPVIESIAGGNSTQYLLFILVLMKPLILYL